MSETNVCACGHAEMLHYKNGKHPEVRPCWHKDGELYCPCDQFSAPLAAPSDTTSTTTRIERDRTIKGREVFPGGDPFRAAPLAAERGEDNDFVAAAEHAQKILDFKGGYGFSYQPPDKNLAAAFLALASRPAVPAEVREALVRLRQAWPSPDGIEGGYEDGWHSALDHVAHELDALLASRPQAGEGEAVVCEHALNYTERCAVACESCKVAYRDCIIYAHPPVAPAGVTGLNRADVSKFLGNVVTQMRVIQRTNEEGGRVAAQLRVLADEVQAWAAALTSEGA